MLLKSMFPLFRELLKVQEEEDVSFDLPPGIGNKLDVSREHSLRGAPSSMMSPDSSRDDTSISGSETHMVSSESVEPGTSITSS